MIEINPAEDFAGLEIPQTGFSVDLLAAYGVAEAGAWMAEAWELRSTNGGRQGTVDWCAGVELRAHTGED